jgi:replicative DNA helicase
LKPTPNNWKPGGKIKPADLPPLTRLGEGAAEDYEAGIPEKFVPSGFTPLDEYILGAISAELVLVGGKPGDGKTAFCTQWAIENAQAGGVSAIMSLEMGRRALRNRLVSQVSGVPMKMLRTKEWASEKHKKLALDAAEWLNELPLYVDDRSGLNPDQVYETIVSWKARGVTLGVVDYIQLLSGDNDSRVVQVGDAVKAVKNAAKDADIPIVGVASLNRGEAGSDRPPRLRDLRDSGELEFVGDTIIMLHYPEDDKQEPIRIVDFHVLKNKNGPCGIASGLFNQAATRFEEAK